MEEVTGVTEQVHQRKSRITKKQSKEFINWYWANLYLDDLTINDIIEEYYKHSNIKVSRMFVSNIRQRFIKA